MNKFKTVVIGAGIAGLTAARALRRAGENVLVLEKSRGLGGRAATRRLHGHRLDHGAQYFTVRDERFQTQVDQWLDEGQLKVWSEGFHTLTDKGLETPSGGHPRYVFPTGMNTIGKLLGAELEIQTQSKVERITRVGEGWRLELEGDSPITAERVLINVPAPQALALCRDAELSQETMNALQEVKFAPCFTLMAGYQRQDLEWRGVTVKAEEVSKTLSWMSRDSSKRSESSDEITLVLNASPDFSEKHLEGNREVVREEMLAAATALGEWITAPNWTDMQRWLYSMVTEPYPEPYLTRRFASFLWRLVRRREGRGGVSVGVRSWSGVDLLDRFLNYG